MAKRKQSKETSAKGISVELTGLILILVGVIGFGFGYIGSIIKSFAMFLLGTWWIIFIIYLCLVGAFMLFKRKMPKFFSARLIGFYLLVIVLLTFTHLEFLNNAKEPIDILNTTLGNYQERLSTIDMTNALLNAGNTNISIGGGIIGAIVLWGLYVLFARTGAIIILVVVGVFGAVLFLDITFSDIVEKISNAFKREKKVHEKDEEELPNLPDVSEDAVKELRKIEEDEIEEKEEVIVTHKLEDIKNNQIETKIETPVVVEQEKEYSGTYLLPSIDILNKVKPQNTAANQMKIKTNGDNLIKVLKDFGITANIEDFHIGAAFTQYEIRVPAGTKVSGILSINKEIALALEAKDVRIEAPIPGKSTIGVEVPNQEIASVPFREILEANQKNKDKYGIMITLGKDIMGEKIVTDLTKMPHLLVAGSTGSGKSVCMNAIICSILMNYRPDEVKMVLVDPKKVEFTNYQKIPHLKWGVINDPKAAAQKLQSIVAEMDYRYDEFSKNGVKKIEEYNDKIDKENKRHKDNEKQRMPYIVVIIDELADLMLVSRKDKSLKVEDSIQRITQLARAAGIHLIVATQRPSKEVITGVIKANIPSRICFAVASNIDSRTALDMSGAEKLLGKGDMLFVPMGATRPDRIQGCFISDDEIGRLIGFCTDQQEFTEPVIHEEDISSNESLGDEVIDDSDDAMYDEVVAFAIETGKISASLIQRKFRFGFNRAARMIDTLEKRGIVGPQNGSKPREVLIKKDE